MKRGWLTRAKALKGLRGAIWQALREPKTMQKIVKMIDAVAPRRLPKIDKQIKNCLNCGFSEAQIQELILEEIEKFLLSKGKPS
jgi:hypothetical protein